ncbi:unnamed protein product [Closterium sp. Naga37s-1]|nr:unnamed protein product [Closterium sp. Naga37s-1]
MLSARLCSLLSLTHLHIDGLSSSIILPLDLGSLHNLRSLSLTGGIWLCLPHSLTRLAPCLQSLKLHYSGHKDADAFRRKLPSFLTSLTSLTNLHLRNMYLPSPPPAFARLRALRTLRIEYNTTFRSHVSFPEDLGQLAALEWLELKCCSTRAGLPQSLCDLGSLRRLYLGSKTLSHLPTAISRLSRLEELTIHWCHSLTTLPRGFGQLGALRKLTIGGASRDYLPDNLSSLSALRVACFSFCKQLHSLPPTLGLLPRLEVLQLRECVALKPLPKSLREARALRHVDVYGSGVAEEGMEVDVCASKVHVVRGRMEGDEYVGTKDRRRKGRRCRGENLGMP